MAKYLWFTKRVYKVLCVTEFSSIGALFCCNAPSEKLPGSSHAQTEHQDPLKRTKAWLPFLRVSAVFETMWRRDKDAPGGLSAARRRTLERSELWDSGQTTRPRAVQHAAVLSLESRPVELGTPVITLLPLSILSFTPSNPKHTLRSS